MSSGDEDQSSATLCPVGGYNHDPGACDTSPDISLSTQNILRYSDVEPQNSDHNKSHEESSSSIETVEEPVCDDNPSNLNADFLQHLNLNPGIDLAHSSLESSDKISLRSDTGSGASLEVITEFTGIPRPESLSLSRSTSEKSQACDKPNSTSLLTNARESTSKKQKCDTVDSVEPFQTNSSIETDQQAEELIGAVGGEELSQSLPEGTITRTGDMIQFVASDLQDKIKQSSPISHPDVGSSGSRRSSIRSIRSFVSASSSTSFATSSGLSQSPASSGFQQSPEDIPPIDAAAVVELEHHASRVAGSLDLMMGNIRNNLHKMSAITIGCQEAYKRSVDITCDSVDGSIKTMYALMAKCEELNASMAPVQQLANQIKEIKRILDLFESQLTDK